MPHKGGRHALTEGSGVCSMDGSATKDAPPQGDEERLRWLEARAEAAYTRMYDAGFNGAIACYSDAKEFLYDAIGLAQRLGKTSEVERLSGRLAHIKAVFRSQFTS